MPRPLLLGHRGARAIRTVPENSIASFDLALAHGCDGFEFDVRVTADGRAVICHDPRVHGVEISSATESDLRELPLLGQVLDRYAKQAFLDIELKVPGLEETVLKLLDLHPPKRGYVVSSFFSAVLADLNKLQAEIPLGLICEDRAQLAAWKSLSVSWVMPHYQLVDESLVTTLHACGRKVFVWTVNDGAMMRRLAGWGVDGLISDNPQRLAEAFRSSAR
jgi:glycerophosphoryl diester phosphodiesterase